MFKKLKESTFGYYKNDETDDVGRRTLKITIILRELRDDEGSIDQEPEDVRK